MEQTTQQGITMLYVRFEQSQLDAFRKTFKRPLTANDISYLHLDPFDQNRNREINAGDLINLDREIDSTETRDRPEDRRKGFEFNSLIESVRKKNAEPPRRPPNFEYYTNHAATSRSARMAIAAPAASASVNPGDLPAQISMPVAPVQIGMHIASAEKPEAQQQPLVPFVSRAQRIAEDIAAARAQVRPITRYFGVEPSFGVISCLLSAAAVGIEKIVQEEKSEFEKITKLRQS